MIRFISSATVRAPHRLVESGATWKRLKFPVRYGIFQHPTKGIVLIDTGYTDLLHAKIGYQGLLYRALLRPEIDHENQPQEILKTLGATSKDVQHVVVTHLHPDHVCGLYDFKHATIHASFETLSLWKEAASLFDGLHGLLRRLLPDYSSLNLNAFESAKERPLPFGLGTGHDIFGDESLVTVNLPGHMKGHSGVIFLQRSKPLLYAVDSAWTRTALHNAAAVPLAVRIVSENLSAVKSTERRVAAFEQAGGEILLCHEPVSREIEP